MSKSSKSSTNDNRHPYIKEYEAIHGRQRWIKTLKEEREMYHENQELTKGKKKRK